MNSSTAFKYSFLCLVARGLENRCDEESGARMPLVPAGGNRKNIFIRLLKELLHSRMTADFRPGNTHH